MELPRKLRRRENAKTHNKNTFYNTTAKPPSVTSTLGAFQVSHCCAPVVVHLVFMLSGVRHALWLFCSGWSD